MTIIITAITIPIPIASIIELINVAKATGNNIAAMIPIMII
jgi:hypothetical protein